MDRNTTILYERLGLVKTATDDEIKKAYRKLALRFHPDKNSTADPEVFKDITRAYEILSDQKKRAVYDRYGEFGVDMLGTVGGAIFDPEIADMLCAFLIAIVIIILLFIVFLILLVLRIDGRLDSNWGVMFIPIWLVDALSALILLGQVMRGSDLLNDNEEDEEEDEVYELTSTDRLAAREARLAQRRRALHYHNALSAIYFFLFMAFQVLLVLHLNGDRVLALVVFIPYFAMEGLNLLAACASTVEELAKPKSTEYEDGEEEGPKEPRTFMETAVVVFANLWWRTLRTLFMVLVALQVDGVIHTHWAVIFIPLFLVFLRYAAGLLVSYYTIRRFHNDESKREAYRSIILRIVCLVVFATLAYSTIGLGIKKLEDTSSISAVVVLTPIFVAIGLLICCTGCCALCFLTRGLEDSGAAEEGMSNLAKVVNPNRRITEGSETDEEILPGGEAWGERRKKDKRIRMQKRSENGETSTSRLATNPPLPTA